MAVTYENFELGEKALDLAVYAQAGTIFKALSELVSNATDAGSTEVHIDLTEKGFRVSDKGCGFKSLEEIDNYFAQVAFDHSGERHQGDSYIGRHGLGRMQIMVYSNAQWRTHTFCMSTDIKNKGLEFDLTQNLDFVEGCTVSGEWYDPLSKLEIVQTTQSLVDLFEYLPTPLYINGRKINSSRSELPDIDNDLFTYYREKSVGTAMVYNCGVKVGPVWSETMDNGIVITKKSLKLNTARTSILLNECTVWREIANSIDTFLDNEAVEITKSKRRHNVSTISRVWDALYANRIHPMRVMQNHIIRCAKGPHLTPLELEQETRQIFFGEGDSTNSEAQAMHDDSIVLAMNDIGTRMSPSSIRAALNISFPCESKYFQFENKNSDDNTTTKKEFTTIDPAKLTPLQSAVFQALQIFVDELRHTGTIAKQLVPARNLKESNPAHESFIADETTVYVWVQGRMAGTADSFIQACNLLYLFMLHKRDLTGRTFNLIGDSSEDELSDLAATVQEFALDIHQASISALTALSIQLSKIDQQRKDVSNIVTLNDSLNKTLTKLANA